ncbi:hypothetical protein JCM14076_16070 [Methylosoma difficile]
MTLQEFLTLPYEMVATAIASITISSITLIQIIALSSKRHSSANSKVFPSLAVILQVIYGLLVCFGFTWWTFNLITIELFNWAAVSGCFALVGIIMPIVVWINAKKHAHKQTDITDNTLAKQSDEAQAHSTAEASTDPEDATETEIANLFAEMDFDDDEMETDTQDAAIASEALSAAIGNTIISTTKSCTQKTILPEDSILRRHTLSLLRQQITESLTAAPSDSILKRHHAQWLATEIEKQLRAALDL